MPRVWFPGAGLDFGCEVALPEGRRCGWSLACQVRGCSDGALPRPLLVGSGRAGGFACHNSEHADVAAGAIDQGQDGSDSSGAKIRQHAA